MRTDETPRAWARRMVEEHAVPEPNTGCYLWTRSAGRNGYAYASYKGRLRKVTRALLDLPALPAGVKRGPTVLYACHRCDTPSCVNEAHLFAGTQSENKWDASRKGRIGPPKGYCRVGHPMTPENTKRRGAWLICRACVNGWKKKWRVRKRLRRAVTPGAPDRATLPPHHEP